MASWVTETLLLELHPVCSLGVTRLIGVSSSQRSVQPGSSLHSTSLQLTKSDRWSSVKDTPILCHCEGANSSFRESVMLRKGQLVPRP